MSLIVVNPTHRKPKAKKKAVHKEKNPMAKKRRSAAQKAAFSRMLAGRKRHRNPAPKRRRRVTRNPSSRKVYTRRRNPGTGAGSLMNELLSKDGLMMIAAVVGTPTLTELAVSYLMPTASGTTRSLVKAGLGLGIGYGVYRFVSKKAGVIVALVSVGSAASDLINSYMNTSSVAASSVVKGYLPSSQGQGMGRMGGLRGYSEPGVVMI
jgi:hypothetical protein